MNFYLFTLFAFSAMAVYCDARNNYFIFMQNDFISTGKLQGLIDLQKSNWKVWRSLMIVSFVGLVCSSIALVYLDCDSTEKMLLMLVDVPAVYLIVRWGSFDATLNYMRFEKVNARSYDYMPFWVRTSLAVIFVIFIIGINNEIL